MRCSTIARCVWMRDKRLYKILTAHSELARGFLSLDDEGLPILTDPVAYEDFLLALKNKDFVAQRRAISEIFTPDSSVMKPTALNRKKNKLEAIDRLAALWLPETPRIIILGSRVSEEEAHSLDLQTVDVPTDSSGKFLFSGAAHTKIVVQFWEKIFAHCHPDILPEDAAFCFGQLRHEQVELGTCTPL
jgi:hypothetical protein